MEEQLVREAIREVLEKQGRVGVVGTEPHKNGMFTPFISVDGHNFKSMVFYKEGMICLEMYENLALVPSGRDSFERKVQRADSTLEPPRGEKRLLRIGTTSRFTQLAAIALVPIKIEDGKERIIEVFHSKFFKLITVITMLYFGMFDGPDDGIRNEPTLTPAA